MNKKLEGTGTGAVLTTLSSWCTCCVTITVGAPFAIFWLIQAIRFWHRELEDENGEFQYYINPKIDMWFRVSIGYTIFQMFVECFKMCCTPCTYSTCMKWGLVSKIDLGVDAIHLLIDGVWGIYCWYSDPIPAIYVSWWLFALMLVILPYLSWIVNCLFCCCFWGKSDSEK